MAGGGVLMYPVSARFLDALTSSHYAVHRVRVYGETRLFGANPPASPVELSVISGSVKMTADSDIKSTATITVAPTDDAWLSCLPYGNELFIERGIDFGDRTREWVPLGWFRIDKVEQDDAPKGPITVTCTDRTSWLIDNRPLFPYAFPANSTHRLAFQRLVNGDAGGGQSTAGYGMFVFTPVPITWTAYNPDQRRLSGENALVEDSSYEFLAKIANEAGAQLRFSDVGELVIEPIGGADGPPVYSIDTGPDGNAIKISRTVSRAGVYNIVSAYSADPANAWGYKLAYNEDWDSQLHWSGKFGVVPRFYSSPLLTTPSAGAAAARSILSRYRDLPAEIATTVVPNPALRPYDNILIRGAPLRIATVEIPLTGQDPVSIGCIPLNRVITEEDGTS